MCKACAAPVTLVSCQPCLDPLPLTREALKKVVPGSLSLSRSRAQTVWCVGGKQGKESMRKKQRHRINGPQACCSARQGAWAPASRAFCVRASCPASLYSLLAVAGGPVSTSLSLSLPLSLSPSLPLSLSPSLPLSPVLALFRLLAGSRSRSRALSLARSLALSLSCSRSRSTSCLLSLAFSRAGALARAGAPSFAPRLSPFGLRVVHVVCCYAVCVCV
jgi:hypothetical protein